MELIDTAANVGQGFVMEFRDRLAEAMRARGLASFDGDGETFHVREAGRRCGLAHSTIGRYLTEDRARKSAEHLDKLAHGLGIRLEWLQTGKGPMEPGHDEEVENPIEAGFRRFREYVRDREAQHLALVPEFLEWRSRGASRYPATISALDVEEELVIDFRRWRRGRDVGDGAGATMVRSKTGRALPGTE